MKICRDCKKKMGLWEWINNNIPNQCDDCYKKESMEKQKEKLKVCYDGQPHDFMISLETSQFCGEEYKYKRVTCKKPLCPLDEHISLK